MASKIRHRGTGYSCPNCGAELTTEDTLSLVPIDGRAIAAHKSCPTYIVVAKGLHTFDAGTWEEKPLWAQEKDGTWVR